MTCGDHSVAHEHTNSGDGDGEWIEYRAEQDGASERQQMRENSGRREGRVQLLGQEGAHDEALERCVRDHRDGQQVAEGVQERGRLTHQRTVDARVHQFVLLLPLLELCVRVDGRSGSDRDGRRLELQRRAAGAQHREEFGGDREQCESARDEAGDEQRAERQPVARLELVHADQSDERERLQRRTHERERRQHAETHDAGRRRPPVAHAGPLPLGVRR